MSSINPLKPIDEVRHLQIIKESLEKKCYKELFIFLDEYFKNENGVLVKTIANTFYCEHPRAFQLLQTFVRLNLLEKKDSSKNYKIFVKINEDIWEHFRKNGSR